MLKMLKNRFFQHFLKCFFFNFFLKNWGFARSKFWTKNKFNRNINLMHDIKLNTNTNTVYENASYLFLLYF